MAWLDPTFSPAPARPAPPRAIAPPGGAAKRLLDILGALALLAVFAPLMLAAAALVRLDGGPALFAQRRLGAAGAPFACLKFRTMAVDAEARLDALLRRDAGARREWEARQKLEPDPRVTPVGRWLRRWRLDETPQLLNVLRGEMSLVGPRPITASDMARYPGDRAYERSRHFHAYKRVRPGLTGLWQAVGRREAGYAERVRLDRLYVSRRSIALDLLILARTARLMLARPGV